MDKSQESMSWADQAEGEETELPQLQSQARSYDCTFCKRGFSNAQALGGHMNLHRKDRAKLKQTSIDDQEISSTESVGFLNQSSSNLRIEMEHTADHREKASSFSWFLPQPDHETDQSIFKLGQGSHESCPRQLQLFDDSPSDHIVVFSGNEHPIRETKETRNHKKFGNETERGSAKDKDILDLELRLGHEPK